MTCLTRFEGHEGQTTHRASEIAAKLETHTKISIKSRSLPSMCNFIIFYNILFIIKTTSSNRLPGKIKVSTEVAAVLVHVVGIKTELLV